MAATEPMRRVLFDWRYAFVRKIMRPLAVAALVSHPLFYVVDGVILRMNDDLGLRCAMAAVALPVIFGARSEERPPTWLAVYWELSAVLVTAVAFTYFLLLNDFSLYWSTSVVVIGMVYGAVARPLFVPLGWTLGVVASAVVFVAVRGPVPDVHRLLLVGLVGGFGAVVMALVGISLEWTIRQFEIATQALAAARDAAQATERSKSLFLATTSHEVRTPLNGILGSARLMLATPLSAQQRALMEVLNASGEHLLRIVDDILDLTKLEAGRLRIDADTYCPAAVVDSVIALFQASAAAKGLVLAADVRGARSVTGDGSRLRQVLMNLVHNAIKFTETGSVTVRVRLTPLDEARSSLRCEVDDTGTGLADGSETLIWEPFAQAEGAASVGGTGLGLTICRRLIEAQHGTIGAENRASGGARFWFELVQGNAERVDAQSHPRQEPVLIRKNARALVVDDNEVNRLVATAYLKRAGVEASGAADGEEALAELAREDYDLVLMDCRMPNMDGLEATRRLRKREVTRRTTVVALTASAAVEDSEECLSAGMDDVLSKPLDEARLNELLRKWLGEPAAG